MTLHDNASTAALAVTQTFVVTGLWAVLFDNRVISLLMFILAVISFVVQIYYRHKEHKTKLKELEIKYGKLSDFTES